MVYPDSCGRAIGWYTRNPVNSRARWRHREALTRR
jgi:hypothetical protein